MDDYKNETGKGAIGIMPLYAPEELVYATGYLPIDVYKRQGVYRWQFRDCVLLKISLF